MLTAFQNLSVLAFQFSHLFFLHFALVNHPQVAGSCLWRLVRRYELQKRETRQRRVGFPAHENNLVRTGTEIKYLRHDLIIVLTPGPSPAHDALLESRCDGHNVPDHG